MVSKKSALSLAIGSAFVASMAAAPVVNAAENPFAMDSLKNGYQVAGDAKGAEGKCGGDKAKKGAEGKCGEGKCGGNKAKKDKEGKGGEGKCGGDK